MGESEALLPGAGSPRNLKKTEDGLEEWKALWSGSWTLVDVFERDGRRWHLARHRAGARPDRTRTLQPRELHVVRAVVAGRPLKIIAHELGLAISTVASTLSRAMRKLRLGSRAELARSLSSTLGPSALPSQK
ncbi:MAG: LuxR C-terminal-related transcriptional regulator [Polyangiaceae bacterium]